MSHRLVKGTVAVLSLAAALAPGLASAQSYAQPYGYDNAPRYAHRYNPREGLQRNGCVKWCEFDMNPCDPPQYKVADGRCNDDDN